MMNPWVRFETRRGCSWSAVSLSCICVSFCMLHCFEVILKFVKCIKFVKIESKQDRYLLYNACKKFKQEEFFKNKRNTYCPIWPTQKQQIACFHGKLWDRLWVICGPKFAIIYVFLRSKIGKACRNNPKFARFEIQIAQGQSQIYSCNQVIWDSLTSCKIFDSFDSDSILQPSDCNCFNCFYKNQVTFVFQYFILNLKIFLNL